MARLGISLKEKYLQWEPSTYLGDFLVSDPMNKGATQAEPIQGQGAREHNTQSRSFAGY